MNCILIAGPAAEPFTLAQAKAAARTAINSVEHDALLTRLITTARKKVENDTGRRLGSQKWQLSTHYWPKSNYLTLPECPVISVESVNYTTTGGLLTLNPSLYTVQVRPDTRGALWMNDGEEWPVSSILKYPGLVINFTCGHTTIPDELKEAISALIVYWYDNPEAAIASTAYKAEVGILPLRYHELIEPFKLWGR